MRKLQNIIHKISSISIILIVLILWQMLSNFDIIPKFMLPSPIEVIIAFIDDFSILLSHAKTTLTEAFIGLFFGVLIAFFVAALMDRFKFFKKSIYPIIIITQTIPTVAIAPLLVLWLGYGLLPKITLIIITSFFPVTIGFLDGFSSCDKDSLNLIRSMGANKFQEFFYVKLPNSINYFFAGLRISASYSIVGAVVAEWLGGFSGLGVYMTRVRKSYDFDKMFAVIFFISILSLALMMIITFIQHIVTPWNNTRKNK